MQRKLQIVEGPATLYLVSISAVPAHIGVHLTHLAHNARVRAFVESWAQKHQRNLLLLPRRRRVVRIVVKAMQPVQLAILRRPLQRRDLGIYVIAQQNTFGVPGGQHAEEGVRHSHAAESEGEPF